MSASCGCKAEGAIVHSTHTHVSHGATSVAARDVLGLQAHDEDSVMDMDVVVKYALHDCTVTLFRRLTSNQDFCRYVIWKELICF